MIRLTVFSRDRHSCYEIAINPSCIMFVKEGHEDIAGRHYVPMYLYPSAAKFLSCEKDGWIAVKGHYDEILRRIAIAQTRIPMESGVAK